MPLQQFEAPLQQSGAHLTVASSQQVPQIEEQPVANKAAALAANNKPSVFDVRVMISHS